MITYEIKARISSPIQIRQPEVERETKLLVDATPDCIDALSVESKELST